MNIFSEYVTKSDLNSRQADFLYPLMGLDC